MSAESRSAVTRWLDRASPTVFSAYAIFAAFTTYFCMYAFRKPFTAAQYEGLQFMGMEFLDLKTAFVTSQIIGYALSKFIGIKVCSEITRQYRAVAMVLLILWAELALLLFAVVPGEWKVAAIFMNGLPLGMVWGLVVAFLEGRRLSDLLLAGLCCSFIVSSAVVKDAGLFLMNDLGVTEYWMPFLTGLCFLPLFFITVWMLHQLPVPSQEDEQLRSKREPMKAKDRYSFVKDYFIGLSLLFVAYFFFTAFRDFRDIYGIEILGQLGLGELPAVFSRTEFFVAFAVLGVMALLVFIQNNRVALFYSYIIMMTGAAMIALSTLLLQFEMINGLWWYGLVGLGGYLAYVPYNCILFERIFASTRAVGTAVFTIYVADAIGYVGSILIQLFKDSLFSEGTRLEFFIGFSYFTAILTIVVLTLSCSYFMRRTQDVEQAFDQAGAPIGPAPEPAPAAKNP